MRKTMNKKVPLEAYVESNELLNKYKIEALNSVMIGLPGETEANVHKTLSFLSTWRYVQGAPHADLGSLVLEIFSRNEVYTDEIGNGLCADHFQ